MKKFGRYYTDEYNEPMPQTLSDDDQDVIDDIEQEKEDAAQDEE